MANCESTWMNETRSVGDGSCIEAGAWITNDSNLSNLGQSTFKNPNLKNLGVESDSSATDLGRTVVSTNDTDSVKSKDQDEKSATHAQDARLKRLLCARGGREPGPRCAMFSVAAQLTSALTAVHFTRCLHSSPCA